MMQIKYSFPNTWQLEKFSNKGFLKQEKAAGLFYA